jgi:hypothetical protein
MRTRPNDFKQALADYRTALKLAVAAAASAKDMSILQIHENGLKLIERQYADTCSVAACRDLITIEQALHEVDGLHGDAVMEMRAAFERLMQLSAC